MYKVLVICYSNTGKTYEAAKEISRQTGGSLCEIYPRQPYPMQKEELSRRMKEEIKSGYRPSLLPFYEKPADYQVIFIGTPNWYGRIASPVASYLKINNLSGKILIPFWTQEGNGKNHITDDCKKLCPKANIVTGRAIMQNPGEGLEKQVFCWLEKIKEKEKRKYEVSCEEDSTD